MSSFQNPLSPSQPVSVLTNSAPLSPSSILRETRSCFAPRPTSGFTVIHSPQWPFFIQGESPGAGTPLALKLGHIYSPQCLKSGTPPPGHLSPNLYFPRGSLLVTLTRPFAPFCCLWRPWGWERMGAVCVSAITSSLLAQLTGVSVLIYFLILQGVFFSPSNKVWYFHCFCFLLAGEGIGCPGSGLGQWRWGAVGTAPGWGVGGGQGALAEDRGTSRISPGSLPSP